MLFDLPLAPPQARPEPEAVPAAEEEAFPLFDDGVEESLAAAETEIEAQPEIAAEAEIDRRARERPVRPELGQLAAAGLTDLGAHLVLAALLVAGTWLLGVRFEPGSWPALAVVLGVFSFLYHIVPLAFWGRTPGMALNGLVARTREGGPLTFGQTGARWLGALVTVALAGLPLLLALAGGSLTDRLSGSVTLERPVARGSS